MDASCSLRERIRPLPTMAEGLCHLMFSNTIGKHFSRCGNVGRRRACLWIFWADYAAFSTKNAIGMYLILALSRPFQIGKDIVLLVAVLVISDGLIAWLFATESHEHEDVDIVGFRLSSFAHSADAIAPRANRRRKMLGIFESHAGSTLSDSPHTTKIRYIIEALITRNRPPLFRRAF